MAQSLLQNLVRELRQLIDPLVVAAEDQAVRREVVLELGLDPGANTPNLNLPQSSLNSINDYLGKSDPDLEAFYSVVQDIILVSNAIDDFIQALSASNPGIVVADIVETLVSLLTLGYLRQRAPILYALFEAIGALDEQSLHFDRFIDLFTHPSTPVPPDEKQAKIVSDSIFIPAAAILAGIGTWLDLEIDAGYGWECGPCPNLRKATLPTNAVGTLVNGVTAGASSIELNNISSATLVRGDWIQVRGNTGQEDAQADFVQIVSSVPTVAPFTLSIDPTLRFDHDAGREVRKPTIDVEATTNLVTPLSTAPTPQPNSTDATNIRVADGSQLALNDWVLIDDANPEIVRLSTGVGTAGAVDIGVTPKLRFTHPANSTSPVADRISSRSMIAAITGETTDAQGGKATGTLSTVWTIVPKSHQGIAVVTNVAGKGKIEVELAKGWKLTVENGPEGFTLRLGAGGGIAGPTTGKFKLAVEYDELDAGKPWIPPYLGEANGSRLQFGEIKVEGEISADDMNVEAKASTKDSALVIAGGSGDGFISKILPPDGLTANFDLGIGVSNKRGVYFDGGSGLSITLPLNKTLGPLKFQLLTLGLKPSQPPKPSSLDLETSLSMSMTLGVFSAVVQRMGVITQIIFPPGGDNRDLKFAFQFKPPNGIGLSLDAAIVKGGGFLYFDPDEEFYAGVLQLSFKGLRLASITAIGLLNTRLPDGTKGYSLLILINLTFNPGLLLVFGITLNGIGGLLGVNRTVKIDRLQQGIKSNTLDSILFPTDPIANAPRIISDLRAVFPPQENRYVFGPIFQLGWGKPNSFVLLEVGLILELPTPVRLAILGILKVVVPDESVDESLKIVKLQVNFLGTIDFDKTKIAFDATLYQSRILTYSITGDMALRANGGANPNILLSVGGFHPAYTPPADMPQLKRITLSLINTDTLRLKAELYFAISANTIQFGERAELYVGVGNLNLYGFIGYDVLFQLFPPYFIGQIDAGLALRAGSSTIMSLHITGSISGPTPWNVRGKGTFKILFVSFDVHFNITFGEEENITLPDVQVEGKLTAALQDQNNWQAQNPTQLTGSVSMRSSAVAPGNVLIQPFGALSVKQNILPLEMAIDRFGAAKVIGTNQFRITQVTSNGTTLNTDHTREQFAPAQFKNMSDAEKLSAPSFEQLPAGVQAKATHLIKLDYVDTRDVEYEEIIIDKQGRRVPLGKSKIVFAQFAAFLQGNAMARSPLSVTRKPDSPLGVPKVAVNAENYAVVNTSDLKLVHAQATASSFAEARNMMNEMLTSRPDLAGSIQIVPSYEVSHA